MIELRVLTSLSLGLGYTNHEARWSTAQQDGILAEYPCMLARKIVGFFWIFLLVFVYRSVTCRFTMQDAERTRRHPIAYKNAPSGNFV